MNEFTLGLSADRISSLLRLMGAVLLPAAIFAEANAQETPLPIPRATRAVDANGVDLLSGSFSDAAPVISIGPRQGGLSFQRVMNDGGRWTDNVMGSIVKACEWNPDVNECRWLNDAHMHVSTGGLASVVFLEQPDGTWTPTHGLAATLTGSGSNWTYTAHDGSVATYALPAIRDYSVLITDTMYVSLASIQTLRRPNGEVLTFHYRQISPGVIVLSSLTTNTGYQLFFEYSGGSMSKAVALNNALETCAPTAATCALVGVWPTLTFTTTESTRTVTDSLGRTTAYTYGLPPNGGIFRRIVGVRRPGRTSGNDLTINYRRRTNPPIEKYGPVVSVTTDTGSWTYGYGAEAQPRKTVTDPLGHTTAYEQQAWAYVERLRTITDAIGNVATNTYEARPMLGLVLTAAASPEGGRAIFTYDLRGNVVERREVSKTPGAPADVVTRAAYPTGCGNPLTCNLPTALTDERGFVTDYTYDGAGNLLTVTGPAATPGGARPRTVYSWEQRYAWYKRDGSGAISRADSPVWVQTGSRSCMTGATC